MRRAVYGMVVVALIWACPMAALGQYDIDLSKAVGNGNFGLVNIGGADVLNLSILGQENTAQDSDYILLKINNTNTFNGGQAIDVNVRLWARNVDGDCNTIITIENLSNVTGTDTVDRKKLTFMLDKNGSGVNATGTDDPGASRVFEETLAGAAGTKDVDLANPNVVPRAAGLLAADAGANAFVPIDSAGISAVLGGTFTADLKLVPGINLLRVTCGSHCPYVSEDVDSSNTQDLNDIARDDDAQILRFRLTREVATANIFSATEGTDFSTEAIADAAAELAALTITPVFDEDCDAAVIAARKPGAGTETFDFTDKCIFYLTGSENLVRADNIRPNRTSGFPFNLLVDQGAGAQHVGDGEDDAAYITSVADVIILDDAISSSQALAGYTGFDAPLMTWEPGHPTQSRFNFSVSNSSEWQTGPCLFITHRDKAGNHPAVDNPITAGIPDGTWVRVFTTHVGRAMHAVNMLTSDLTDGRELLARAPDGMMSWIIVPAGAPGAANNGVFMFWDRPAYGYLSPFGKTLFNRTIAWLAGMPLNPINPADIEGCDCEPNWLHDADVQAMDPSDFTGKRVASVSQEIGNGAPTDASGTLFWGLYNLGATLSAQNAGTAVANAGTIIANNDAVLISQPGTGTAFTDAAIGVLTSEKTDVANLGLYETSVGLNPVGTMDMVIEDSGHPITAGLTAGCTYRVVQKVNQNTTNRYTGVQPAGTVVLGRTADAGEPCFLAMDTGGARLSAVDGGPGGTAPGRRVAFFFNADKHDATSTGGSDPNTAISGPDLVKSVESLTPLGAVLAARSIAWACGDTLSPIQNPPNPVDCPPTPSIPAISTLGMGVLTLLFVVAAVVVVRRRRLVVA